jgi:hypothetical protein
MERVLLRLKRQRNGQISVDGQTVECRLVPLYTDYLDIEDYVSAHPGDVKGAYEEIWTHGGESRSFTDDTGDSESAVSTLFAAYQDATGAATP